MHNVPRVLVVEDQYLIAHDCEFHLRSAGFECVGLASTAQQAVDLAQREHPDLIVMDIRLAGQGDGVQAAIDIYQRFGIRSIFTSGHADSQVRNQARPAKPLGWLDKPYTPEALLAAITAALPEVSKSSIH
jgi:two-component system, response regulator PdtaR